MYGDSKGTINLNFDNTNSRLLFFLICGVLGIILLSDVTFKATYPEVYQSDVLRAGLSPLNASILSQAGFSSTAISEFWWYFPSVMTNSAILTSTPPLTCSDPACFSCFLPGGMGIVEFDTNLPTIGKDNFSDATAFVVNDAPGFQIEYSPIDGDLVLEEDDCRVYGTDTVALQICVKQTASGLVGGKDSNPRMRLMLSIECMSIGRFRSTCLSKFNGLADQHRVRYQD